MPVQQLVLYLMIYGIPGVVLYSVASVIITQNYRNTTNRLIAVLIFLYSFIFFEEFIRYLLPNSHNSIMLHLSFGIISILIITITFHFFIHIAKLPERILIPFYPFICYIPFFILVIVLLFNFKSIAKIEIIQNSIWDTPIFNLPYYATLAIASTVMLIFIGILLNGIKHATSITSRKILRLFIFGTIFVLLIRFLFEYPTFNWALPRHPFILIGFIFPVLLAISAFKFNLLPSAVKKYQAMFNLIPISITVINSDWDILELNDYSRKEIFRHGHKNLNMLHFVQTDNNKEVLHQFIALLDDKEVLRDYPLTFIINDTQEIVHYSVDTSTIFLEEDKIFYLIWRNVTEELENDRLIEHMAYHDVLTSLHNRAYFVPKVKDRMTRLAASSTKESALVLIDLNRFKRINDTYGHAIGDEVLQHTAMLLKQAVRTNDLVARLGGDEFVIFLENFPTQQAVTDWCTRLLEDFAEDKFTSESITLQIEPSIGIAFFPADANNFKDLFQLADANMYKHKLKSKEKDMEH
ncbi:GGDEF domain-containing protein [Sporosarcina beigongshangi]|uniref:GGDEF domain-containing protein n=1 Tax=Sporosarcina beigongshangi TaxID=2782538 RepID=UPI00193A76D0|nr:GGDEF domain-containing protein [Sporosarcina beigongshangi]